MTSKWKPIVCTLNRRDARAQALEWVDLQGIATSAVAIANGATMTFPATYAERVADLARREASCCAFLTITTELEGEQFILNVTSENSDGQAVIAWLAGLDEHKGVGSVA